MFAIYLKSGINVSEQGYFKDSKTYIKTINGNNYRINVPILCDKECSRTYKRYSSVERYCERLPEILKIFCSDGSRYGWKHRCLYDIFIVDLDTGESKKVFNSELRESLINDDVRRGLQGYY